MYSQVINYIKQRIEISREEIEESLKYSNYKKFARGDYILTAGEHCRFIGFLNKGFIVTTFVDDTPDELIHFQLWCCMCYPYVIYRFVFSSFQY